MLPTLQQLTVHMEGPRALFLAVTLLMLILGPAPAGGAFVVTAVTANTGVSSFVGLELIAAPFAFSRRDFVVDAPVALTRNAEWSTRACPPTYLESAAFAGSILIHVDAQWTACSFEPYAVAAGQLGAVLWAPWDSDLVRQGIRPGIVKNYWQTGDRRALASPVELAACRLYAFVRADRGLKATLGNVVLCIELLLNIERVLYVALDPISSNGSVEIRLGFFLFSIHVPLATVSTGLFFIFFVEATRRERRCPLDRRRGRADWRAHRRARPLGRAGLPDARVVPFRAAPVRAAPAPTRGAVRARG
jgi:hypothetical protein